MITSTKQSSSGASNNNSIAGWTFSEQEIHQAINEYRLLNPSIDLSNLCNLNCPYCFTEGKNSERKLRLPNELSIDDTISILGDFASSGAKTINIVGAGEPTIDPHFELVVQRTEFGEGRKETLVLKHFTGAKFLLYCFILYVYWDHTKTTTSGYA